MNELKITKELYDEVKTLNIKPNGTFDDKVKTLLTSILITVYFPEKETNEFIAIIDKSKQRHYDVSIQDHAIFVDDDVYHAIEALDSGDMNETTCFVLIKSLTMYKMPSSELDKINAIIFKVMEMSNKLSN